MDQPLRCNIIRCRRELTDHAVIANCGHIFCIDCSNRYQLSGQQEIQRRICPQCNTQFTNPDDVVVANLNPTEDYKTSVLSGLSPNIIMECAGRALSFWSWQATQEINYQMYQARKLSDNYASLSTQMEQLQNDANAKMSNLQNKLSNMQVDFDTLKRKNEEITQALRERNKKCLQVQEMYDKLKRKAMLGQVQDAAVNSVDQTIQASVQANRFVDKIGNSGLRPPPHPLFSDQSTRQFPEASHPATSGLGPQIGRSGNGDSGWAEYGSQGSNSQTQPMQTPSTHRQRLSGVSGPLIRDVPPQMHAMRTASTPIQQQRRQPLTHISNNRTSPSTSGFAGYGMSAGLKVSNPAAVGVNRTSSSRVAHRPTTNFQGAGHAQPNPFARGDSYY